MGIRKIEGLLRALAARDEDRARPELAQEIKSQIPARLVVHRMDSVGNVAELRISRLAAAAVILLALLVTGSFFGGTDAIGKQMYEDSKLLLRYTFAGENACKSQILDSLKQFHDDMAAQGRDIVFYGDHVDFNNRCAVVMHWKLSDGKYGVVLGDLSVRTVSSDTLIRLQNHMLRERTNP